MASFDSTFDYTFQGPDTAVTPVAPPVNTCGVTLMWLTGASWATWTFEAVQDTALNATSVGSFSRGNLTIDTQRRGLPGKKLRTGKLSQAASEQLASVIQSTAVYMLHIDSDGLLAPSPIRVETNELGVWTTSRNRTEQEITIALPYTLSLRR